ncbi:hypothetical protein OGH69_16030 [Flavobacterium sp. MFBS3-15]|uniref:hypothetical protein n=1 Tax=Flavobacterium sp. MFBS3-15 TaxID=2989816 RepID=UPI002235D67E|nr:hypothetical protein [Flavobacterium sp. MFBS3-15]MCW4470481.1 hypothetical protein [Flavobacterium sp. MFBS3-15]
MKSSLLKLYIFAFLFVGDFVMFAEEPGAECEDENGNPIEGCLEDGSSDPVAPINTKLIWLALIGISFVVYYFNRGQEDKKSLQ